MLANNRARLLSALAVTAIYFALASWLAMSGVNPTPKGKIVYRIRQPFEVYPGSHLVLYPQMEAWRGIADTEREPQRSPVLLYEDNRLLGPPHSSLDDIATLGEGRYSHWLRQGLVFSTSDNSNPNTNDRIYLIVVPE
jgi:hypothetical protein